MVALDGDVVTVDYGDGTTAALWRHAGLDDRVRLGEAVKVCERWSLLAVAGPEGARWLSVGVSPTGGRPVKGPREVAIRPAVHAGVVDLATGEAIDLLRAHRA